MAGSSLPGAWGVWQFRVSRLAARGMMRLAALLTFERIPPFVSTSAIVQDGDRILTIFDAIRREPVLPGGHLKWRESPEQAVVREVWEETGYQIALDQLIGVYSGEEWTGEPGVVRVIYRATVTGGRLQASAEGEPSWIERERFLAAGSRDAPILRSAPGWESRPE